MNTYVYQGTLYCEDCGESIKRDLHSKKQVPKDESDESSYDSDDFPKGPYLDGGGEADSPQHCDSGEHCLNAIVLPNGNKIGAWLENDLTSDGIGYVTKTILDGLHRPDIHARQASRLWNELYKDVLPSDLDTLAEHTEPREKEKIQRNTVDECLLAAVMEGSKGTLNRIFHDLNHVYAVGWKNVYASRTTMKPTHSERFTIWRTTALPNGDFSELIEVSLPSSEPRERSIEDILRELIENEAWE